MLIAVVILVVPTPVFVVVPSLGVAVVMVVSPSFLPTRTIGTIIITDIKTIPIKINRYFLFETCWHLKWFNVIHHWWKGKIYSHTISLPNHLIFQMCFGLLMETKKRFSCSYTQIILFHIPYSSVSCFWCDLIFWLFMFGGNVLDEYQWKELFAKKYSIVSFERSQTSIFLSADLISFIDLWYFVLLNSIAYLYESTEVFFLIKRPINIFSTFCNPYFY